MKKKSFIPIVVTLLVVTIISFVYSCKDEPLDFTHSKVENQKSAKLETAKQWFRQNESGITFSKSGESIGKDGAYFPSFSGEPSWKYYAVTENENLEVIDVDLTDRINQDFILKNSFKNYKKNHQLKLRRSYTRYVHVKNKKTGKEQGFFMTIVPTPYYARTYSHRIRLNTYLKRDKYLGGYVLFHNFEGKFVNGWKYKKGKIVGRVLPNGVSTNPAKRKLALVKLKAKYIVKPQLYTPIKTKSGDESFYDDSWNNDDYDNTTVELDPLVAEGTNNDGWATDEDPDEGVNLYEEPEEEPLPEDDDPCPYNDCYDDNRGNITKPKAKDKYEKLDSIITKDIKNNPCLMNVYNKLRNNENKTFDSIIKPFDPKGSIANIRFTIEDLKSIKKANTVVPNNGWMTIRFNRKYLGKISSLEIASNFIHEIIHATIFRYMLTASNTGHLDYGKMTKEEKIEYEKRLMGMSNYKIYEYYWKGREKNWQHKIMIEDYMDIFVKALKSYDDSKHSDDVYKAFAWSGLVGYYDEKGNFIYTDEWNNLSPKEKSLYGKLINEIKDKIKYPPCQQ